MPSGSGHWVTTHGRSPTTTPIGGSACRRGTRRRRHRGRRIDRRRVPGRGEVTVSRSGEIVRYSTVAIWPGSKCMNFRFSLSSDLAGVGRVEGVGAQGAAQPAHDHGRGEARTGDVAHHDAEPDRRGGRRRRTSRRRRRSRRPGTNRRRHLEAVDARQAAGQQAALQGAGGRALGSPPARRSSAVAMRSPTACITTRSSAPK